VFEVQAIIKRRGHTLLKPMLTVVLNPVRVFDLDCLYGVVFVGEGNGAGIV
jgi:hypothetical protein